ncbi:hypothetical protein MTO96_030386 [Rhipicephalus appendiculatus]
MSSRLRGPLPLPAVADDAVVADEPEEERGGAAPVEWREGRKEKRCRLVAPRRERRMKLSLRTSFSNFANTCTLTLAPRLRRHTEPATSTDETVPRDNDG